MTVRGDQIREMLVAGKNYGEIRRELGVAASTIAYHAKRMGLTGTSKYGQRIDWKAVQAFYDAGATIRQTITHFGMSRSAWSDSVRDGTILLSDTPARKALLKISRLVDRSRHHQIPHDEMFCINSKSSTGTVKKRVVRDSLVLHHCSNPRCLLHGITNPSWAGLPITLHLDHVNGVSNDHRLENLRFLCPNCHSQTATYCGRNKG
jgi:hypothetical protein